MSRRLETRKEERNREREGRKGKGGEMTRVAGRRERCEVWCLSLSVCLSGAARSGEVWLLLVFGSAQHTTARGARRVQLLVQVLLLHWSTQVKGLLISEGKRERARVRKSASYQ
jgi:hypothetical protein